MTPYKYSTVKGEACLANTVPGDHFQFLRQGYFVTDKDSTPEHIVMNRIVGLRDSWLKNKRNNIVFVVANMMLKNRPSVGGSLILCCY